MPTLTTTIEDYSPLIIYTSDWIPGTSSNDPYLDRFSAKAFMLTGTAGGTASFTFNGTGVTLYGAQRGGCGVYQITLDDTQYAPVNASIPEPGLFHVPLFQKTGLQQGQHLLVARNVGPTGWFLNVDTITWEGNVGETQGDNLYVHTFDDVDLAFEYDASWLNNPPELGSFSGGTGHVTSTPGASFTFTFKVRDAVSLYGPVSSNGAAYAVQLDNAGTQYFNSSAHYYTPQVLLYQAANLGLGEHKLKVAYQSDTASGKLLAIDYATVHTTVDSNVTTSSASGGRLSTGPIIGISLASFAVGALFIALFFIALRRRESQTKAPDEKMKATPFYATPAPEPLNGIHAATSDPHLRNPQSHIAPTSGDAVRKERFIQRVSIDPFGSSGASYSPVPQGPAAGSSSAARNRFDDAFPPDYAQATTRLIARD